MKDLIQLRKNDLYLIHVIIFLISAQLLFSQSGLQLIGKVKPRYSHEITSSNFSIGGETMDRDFTDFNSWKSYLGQTGAKKVRLQAGWAKCEPEKGVYNFAWLDDIIDECIYQDVEPWLQLSYGNPIYEGGGDIHLSGGFPTSEAALNAWDQWASQLAKRYGGKVKVWEIWNESDQNKANTAEAYSQIFIRSSEIIRSEITDATIYALSLAGINRTGYVNEFLNYLKSRDKLHLVDAITLHGYTKRPEDNYEQYHQILKIIQQYSDQIYIVQGELGCPSENQEFYALRHHPWTETSQAKWLLRRLLGDLGHDIPSLYFTIIDINYIRRYKNENGVITPLEEPIITTNTKGLLKANEDNSVAHKKQSFYTYQVLTSIFDHRLERIPNYPYIMDHNASISLYGFRAKNYDYQAVAIWLDGEIPNDFTDKKQVNLEFPQAHFQEPVFVDMRTGEVFALSTSTYQRRGTNYRFQNIPIYDSPILLIDRSLISLQQNDSEN